MSQQHMQNIRQAWQQKCIAVLMGGLSSEREISQKTGAAILQALLRKGYQAIPVDVDRNVGSTLRDHGIQVAYLALHGSLGEDGTIQGLLEIMGIPYTGSGVLASALAINKVAAKKLFRYHGVLTPEFQSFQTAAISTADIQSRITIPPPLVVKPAEEGSTIGIGIVSNRQDLPAALERACRYGTEVLVEAFITGREITVGVIDGRPLPAVEIRPKSGFYDFTSKYTKGKTEYLVPAPLDPAAAAAISDAAAAAYYALGCRSNARVDFILSAEGQPFVLEVNTIPGMTETSLLPMAAREAGIDFDSLVEMILWSATLEKRSEKT